MKIAIATKNAGKLKEFKELAMETPYEFIQIPESIKELPPETGNSFYENALINSHDSIGRAIFFTGITIIFGFSILILSNFIPTILFGLFTGLAMLVALLAVLTLLPKLIISIRPFS